MVLGVRILGYESGSSKRRKELETRSLKRLCREMRFRALAEIQIGTNVIADVVGLGYLDAPKG